MIQATILTVLLAVICAAQLSGLPPRAQAAPDPPGSDVQALLDKGLYQKAEDLARAGVDTVATSSGEDSVEAAAASDILLRALLLNGKGGPPSTLARAVQTVQVKERRLGGTHIDLVPSLQNLGEALLVAGEVRPSDRGSSSGAEPARAEQSSRD